MNRALGHLCPHIGQTGPGEPPEDGDDTVFQTQDSKFEPWRSEAEQRYLLVTEAPHSTEFHTWMGKKHFVRQNLTPTDVRF